MAPCLQRDSSQAAHLMTLSVWLCASGLVLMDWLADARSCRLFCRSMEPFWATEYSMISDGISGVSPSTPSVSMCAARKA